MRVTLCGVVVAVLAVVRIIIGFGFPKQQNLLLKEVAVMRARTMRCVWAVESGAPTGKRQLVDPCHSRHALLRS